MIERMSVFELMMLRSEWEDLARHFRNVGQQGTLDNLEKFLTSGARSNRFRDGYDRAVEIANIIIEQAKLKDETFSIPSVCGEEVEAV